MSSTECIICFDIVRVAIKCKCGSAICTDCLANYLSVSKTDRRIPKCPNCNQYYRLSQIPKHLQNEYATCCFSELLGKHGDSARKTYETKNNVELMRQLREKFLQERFPKGIAFTAQIIMPTKLRKLDKQMIEKIQEQSMKSKRVCMNLTCNGSLNEHFVCLSCDTAFCQDCEKRKDSDHKCDPADIESVNSIKEMAHCPNCNFPIIKSEGCDNMTCANCGQHFLYYTGEAGGNGGHVTMINNQDRRKIMLSSQYMDYLKNNGCLQLVLQIEGMAPSTTNDSTLVHSMIEYYKHQAQVTPKLEMEAAKAFEKYIVKMTTNKRYQQALNEIETHCQKQTLVPGLLSKLIMLLNKPI